MREPSKKKTKRSPCPIACALDTLGDRWTLLIIRDLFLEKQRFKEFAGSPENIPTNLLSERLERLLEARIIERCKSADGSKHSAFRLTKKGEALRPLLLAMRDWSLKWVPGTAALLEQSKQ